MLILLTFYTKKEYRSVYAISSMTLYIFVEIKKEIFEKEKRVHSIDTFCNIYKRNNLDKAIPSTKTVYEIIHRGETKGIKPYMLPRMTKLKPRKKTDWTT
ncbi:hypothetical protein AB8B23_11495 [Leptotrichia sp. HSP-342]|uniref:Uncharacterized protein n=1 Tax=Leptotrichia mesophila TaxID=3239303 RepID=A0AB39V9M5_9FUSO